MLSSPSPKQCIRCGKSFVPKYTSMQVACSVVCARRYATSERQSREKAEKQQIKARKERIKTRREWIAEAQQAVNKYVRLRDHCAGRGCISCGSKPEERFGGAVDAGHFRSVGSAPHLRYYLPQIRLQCVRCNRYLSGNVAEYRKGLVELMGLERVEQIEAMQGVAKWDTDYLKRLKAVMNKKARRLEKRKEAA